MPGAVVMFSIEGNRPILVGVQGLVNRSSLGAARRSIIGASVAEQKQGRHAHPGGAQRIGVGGTSVSALRGERVGAGECAGEVRHTRGSDYFFGVQKDLA